MAQSMNISNLIAAGGGDNTLPPQVTELKVNVEFTTDTQVKITGTFKNIPAEQRKWLKSFLVVFKKNSLPTLSDDGTGFVVTDIASEVITFTYFLNGAKDGDIYGFKVFSQSVEDNYQTNIEGNVLLVTLNKISSNFDEVAWDVIYKIAQEGTGANYWKVGDSKTMSVYTSYLLDLPTSVTEEEITCHPFIIGFNNNSKLEGNGIDLLFGKEKPNESSLVTFCGKHYGEALVGEPPYFTPPFSYGLVVTPDGASNEGGMWENGLQPRKPFFDNFRMAIRKDFESAGKIEPVKKVTKYTDSAKDNSGSAENVTGCETYSFLLSEYEVYGTTTLSNPHEADKQEQYAYYANGNQKYAKNCFTNSPAKQWLRSRDLSTTTNFCTINEEGKLESNSSNISYGFSVAIKIG